MYYVALLDKRETRRKPNNEGAEAIQTCLTAVPHMQIEFSSIEIFQCKQ